MKKIIQIYAALIIIAFVATLTSCTENPLDKKIDEMEAFTARMDKLLHEENPSREEIESFVTDGRMFKESWTAFASKYDVPSSQATESQKKRLFKIVTKMQNLSYDPNYQRLRRIISQYHLNF